MTADRPGGAQAKHLEAVRLKLSGMTLRQIAKELGYSGAEGARKAVQAGLRDGLDLREADAALLREVAMQRYERLLNAAWPKALAGDTRSIDSAARIVKDIAAMEGIDAPTKVDIAGAADSGYRLIIERRSAGGMDGTA